MNWSHFPICLIQWVLGCLGCILNGGGKPILRQRKLQQKNCQKSLFLHLTKGKPLRVCPSRLFLFSTKPNLLGSPFSLCANFWLLFSTDGGKQRHGGGHEAILKGVLADEGVEPAYVDLRCCVRWLRNH